MIGGSRNLSTSEFAMNAQVLNTEKLSYKHIGNLANALYVLSQHSLKQKLQVVEQTEKINKGEISEQDLTEVKQKIKSVLKTQQYFHSERQIIIHYLLDKDIATFKKYVMVKGIAYGLVKLNKYNLYCIVNKKLIKKFDAVQVGNQFDQMPLLSDDQLEQIISFKEAKRIFKLYYNEVLRQTKKGKKKITKAKLGKKEKPKEKILGTSKSASGSVVVIKKRKPFTLTNKPV